MSESGPVEGKQEPEGEPKPEGEPETEGEPKPKSPPLDASVLAAAADGFEDSLNSTLLSSVVPYGYTVTTWASGAYLIKLRGAPTIWEAFLFVSGAIVAFAILASASQRARKGRPPAPPVQLHPESPHLLFAAGLHIAAVGLSLGAAAAVDHLLGNFAWFLGSFAVTTIYLSIASLEFAIAVEWQRQTISIPGARVIVERPRQVIRRVRRRF